jgi:hypothetical protein
MVNVQIVGVQWSLINAKPARRSNLRPSEKGLDHDKDGISNSQQPERSGDRLERSESNDRREWQRVSNIQGKTLSNTHGNGGRLREVRQKDPPLEIGFECWLLDIENLTEINAFSDGLYLSAILPWGLVMAARWH